MSQLSFTAKVTNRVRCASGDGAASISPVNIRIEKSAAPPSTPGTKYEAESGFKENGAVNYDDAAASGAKGVQGFQNSGAADTIDGGAGGKYILTIRYLNSGSPSNKHVFINGVELPNSVTFPTKPGYDLQCFVVTLNSGATNSLSFQNFSDSGAVKIDSFQFSLQ